MKYNRIEKIFLKKAIIRGGILLLSSENAILFIKKCEEEKVGILGIDGFWIKEGSTQPSLENSIDYSKLNISNDEIYVDAVDFVKKRKSMHFEVVCDL